MLALLEALAGLLAARGRQFDFDHTLARAQRHRKATVAEDANHVMVARQHLGGEDGDAVLLSRGRQMGQHDRRDPPPLPVLGDREGDFRLIVAGTHIGAVGDDRVLEAGARHERIAVGVIDVQRPVRGPAEIDLAEETEGDRLRREPVQEGHDRRTILSTHGSHAHGRAVAQRHVHDL